MLFQANLHQMNDRRVRGAPGRNSFESSRIPYRPVETKICPGQDSNLRWHDEPNTRKGRTRQAGPRSEQPSSLNPEIIARLKRTNLLVQGWVSTDRSEVAALLITTPQPRTKSYTNDFTPPRRMGWISTRPTPALIVGTIKTFFCGSTRGRGARPRRHHIVASRRRGG